MSRQAVRAWLAGVVAAALLVPGLAQASAGATTIVAGHYVHGHEVESFKPCGSERVYWLRADDVPRKHLRTRYRSLTTQPYAPVFAVLEVRPLPPASRGFAADYDGQLHLERVLRVEPERTGGCRRMFD